MGVAMQMQSQDGKGLKLNSKYAESVRVAMRIRGSVLINSLPMAMMSAMIGLCSALVRAGYGFLNSWWATSIVHPLAIQVFGLMFGFLITNRVAAAINRWWDGMSTVSHMLLKWYDSETFILGYLKKDMKLLLLQQARTDLDDVTRQYVEKRIRQLSELRVKLIHWFSLLNAVALSTLKHGESDCMNHVRCSVVDYDWLYAEFTGHQHLSKMEKLRSQFNEGQKDKDSEALGYIGPVTAQEQKSLSMVEEKTALISQWITEALVFSDCEGLLNIAPPLAGRAHMRMADAMQGFNDAYRLAAVPYPFPLAQMVWVLMHAFIVLMPIVIERFTQAWILTPFLCFLVTLSYWGLNSVAMELENPFGDDVNDLPLKELCETYIDKIMEATSATSKDLADDSETVHTYSVLYIDGGCLPIANKAPALFGAVPSKGKTPEEEKLCEKPPAPATSTTQPSDLSTSISQDATAVSSLEVVPSGTSSKKRSHSAGSHSRQHRNQVLRRPLTQYHHPPITWQYEPVYYHTRPPEHQWLIDRAASSDRAVDSRSQSKRSVSGAEHGDAEAAAGGSIHGHVREQKMSRQPVGSQDHHEHKRLQEDPRGPTPRAPHPRSLAPVYARPGTAPPRGYRYDSFQPEIVGYYDEAFDDAVQYHPVISHDYPGSVAPMPTQYRHEGRSHPHQLHHHCVYQGLPSAPMYDGDESFVLASAEDLC